ncbi:septum formation initiator family protein [bacterium]|nr:septum formation initiator family protein [bacterium]
MNKKKRLFWGLILLFVLMFTYINFQINSRINYYTISVKEKQLEQLKDFRRKLLLEYYVLFDYKYVEKAAREKLGFDYSGIHKDVRLVVE